MRAARTAGRLVIAVGLALGMLPAAAAHADTSWPADTAPADSDPLGGTSEAGWWEQRAVPGWSSALTPVPGLSILPGDPCNTGRRSGGRTGGGDPRRNGATCEPTGPAGWDDADALALSASDSPLSILPGDPCNTGRRSGGRTGGGDPRRNGATCEPTGPAGWDDADALASRGGAAGAAAFGNG